MSIFWMLWLFYWEGVEQMAQVKWSVALETLDILERCGCSETVKTIHAAWMALDWKHKQEEDRGGVTGQVDVNSFVVEAVRYWAHTWEFLRTCRNRFLCLCECAKLLSFLGLAVRFRSCNERFFVLGLSEGKQGWQRCLRFRKCCGFSTA